MEYFLNLHLPWRFFCISIRFLLPNVTSRSYFHVNSSSILLVLGSRRLFNSMRGISSSSIPFVWFLRLHSFLVLCYQPTSALSTRDMSSTSILELSSTPPKKQNKKFSVQLGSPIVQPFLSMWPRLFVVFCRLHALFSLYFTIDPKSWTSSVLCVTLSCSMASIFAPFYLVSHGFCGILDYKSHISPQICFCDPFLLYSDNSISWFYKVLFFNWKTSAMYIV